ncbi:MAG TPA: CHAT domain-containing tetratricopeptide repeat protein [Pyrinomonadaceae bacterium]|nr:CHAT domain-containing tetratricopeptide repeat protein [Pyrinomonadaceae bacterium]
MLASRASRLFFLSLSLFSTMLSPVAPRSTAFAQSVPRRAARPAPVRAKTGPQGAQTTAGAEAEQLFKQSKELHEAGKLDEALPLAERALEMARRAFGDEHANVALILGTLGVMYRDKGDYAKSEQVLKRAIEIRERAATPSPRFLAMAYNHLGTVYRDQGEHASAARMFERALSVFEQAFGHDHPETAHIYNNLASLYRDSGDYARAEETYEKALAIYSSKPGSEDLFTVQVLGGMALLYHLRGEYGRALDACKRAVRILKKYPAGSAESITIMDRAGLIFQEQGNYIYAIRMLEGAARLRVKKFGPSHQSVAESLNNLGRLYLLKGDYGLAEQMNRRALEIREKVFGEVHPSTGQSINNLAIVLRRKRDYQAAEQMYTRALEIARRVYGPAHPNYATALGNLAELQYIKGDYEQAEQELLRALEIRSRALGEEHPRVAQALTSLAMIYRAKGDYAQAERMLRRALAIREQVFSNDHPEVAGTLKELAKLSWMNGDTTQAVRLMQSAADITERSLDIMLATGSERQKRLFLRKISSDLSGVISLHLQGAPENTDAASLALTLILRRKGRALDAMSNQVAALRRRAGAKDLALLDELARLRAQLATLVLGRSEQADPAQYREARRKLESRIERLESSVSERSADFRARSQAVVTTASVQQAIPADAALVELVSYWPYNPQAARRGEAWGAQRYAAYVLRPEGAPSFADLGESAPIRQAIAELRAALKDPARADVRAASRRLDEMLMRPVRRLLGDARRVFLSPDGALNLIPFGALLDEHNHYMIEDYSITYLTSGRDLLRLREAAPSREEPLVLANPLFDWSADAPPSKAEDEEQGLEIASRLRSFDFSNVRFSPLPGTAAEAEALRLILPKARVLTGAKATETALKEANAPRVLHIATHGFFLADEEQEASLATPGLSRELEMEEADAQPHRGARENPLLRSGLALAGAARQHGAGGEDGVLTALEASGLDLWGTKLVVLSACDTGVGIATNGEGVYGLRRALVLAGAESQVMSLWPVGDAATKELMIEYYKRLQAGEGRTEALRKVQLGMLRGARRSHPFYWASFIQSGAWTAMNDGAPSLK